MNNTVRRAGYLAFFLSGICAISSGVIVSLLQENRGLDYSTVGTLLSVMSIGNLAAGLLTAVLPERFGLKPTVLLLTCGYALGYALMLPHRSALLLGLGWALVGLGKGCAINTCTLLVAENSPDRTRGMNTMHGAYACGALLCPVLAALAGRLGPDIPMLQLALLGAAMWLVFAAAPISGGQGSKRPKTDWSFLRSRYFWLITVLLFCQNAAETGVTGWLVAYFKDSGILSAVVSPYTVSLLWGTTMAVRLLLAFVFPPRDTRRAMVVMSGGCAVFYIGLVLARTQAPALLLLLGFALFMAGLNPMIVACAGEMTSAASMGILLPVAGLGNILMPWLIGQVAETAGLRIGMAVNILPCVGMLALAVLLQHKAKSV